MEACATPVAVSGQNSAAVHFRNRLADSQSEADAWMADSFCPRENFSNICASCLDGIPAVIPHFNINHIVRQP